MTEMFTASNVTIRLANPADAEGSLATHVASIRKTASQDYTPDSINVWSEGTGNRQTALTGREELRP